MSLVALLLVACGGPSDPPTTDVSSATGDSASQDTGTSRPTTWDPATCADYVSLKPYILDEAATLIVDGVGYPDAAGHAVHCVEGDLLGFGAGVLVSAPETGDVNDGPQGWVGFAPASMAGMHPIDALPLLYRGVDRRDHLGFTIHTLPLDGNQLGVLASSPQFSDNGNFRGAAWIATDPSDDVLRDSSTIMFHGENDQTHVTGAQGHDLDADGFTDVIVGHPNLTLGAVPWSNGKLAFHDGRTIFDHTDHRIDDAAWVYEEPVHSDGIGLDFDVADLNLDGWPDLILPELRLGSARLIYGPLLARGEPGHVPLDDTLIYPPPGADPLELAGFGVRVGHGDMNGDGVTDLLVGSSSATIDGIAGAGAIYVFFGPVAPGETLAAQHADVSLEGNATWSVFARLAVGDHDGDGFDDLVATTTIGPLAADCPGEVYVFRGPLTPSVLKPSDADVTYQDRDVHTIVGYGLDLCDLDGDGADEIVVGTPGARPGGIEFAGRAYVLPGRPHGAR